MTATQKLPTRAEIPVEYTWDLMTIYPGDAEWEADAVRLEQMLSEVAALEGTLVAGPLALLKVLEACDRVSLLLGRLSVYAMCLFDTNSLSARAQAIAERADALTSEASAVVAFVEPEILELTDATIAQWLQDEPALDHYRYALGELARQRQHVCMTEIEAILSAAEEVTRAPSSIFDMLTEADLAFGTIADEAGNPLQISFGRFVRCMYSHDRRVRRDAFTTFYSAFAGLRNTFGALLAAEVRTHIFLARARGYDSCLQAALDPHAIPGAVYTNLVLTVERHLDRLHRYVHLRKRMMALENLHVYDLFAPLSSDTTITIPYPEAVQTIRAALGPLGPEYSVALDQILQNRQIDVYEHVGKATRAYTTSIYPSAPLILLNYQDRLSDVFVLAHELGHAVHAWFTRQSQPYLYSDPAQFVGEVAAILNEILLACHLIQHADTPARRACLIAQQLKEMHVSLFRQTLLASFEHDIHRRGEAGAPLTTALLCEEYYNLMARYHGPDLALDEEIGLEWARDGHLYHNFYVYQYATGMAAALALSEQVLAEGPPAIARLIQFLRSGSSRAPIDLLRDAGVDMTTPQPIEQALDHFAKLLDQLEALDVRRDKPPSRQVAKLSKYSA